VLRISRGRIVGGLIVAFWAVMTGSLVYHEIIRPRLGLVTPARSTARPMDLWLGVFAADDARVGYVHTTSTPLLRDGEPGARLSLTADLRVPLLATATRVFLTGKAWLDGERGLTDFELRLRLGDQEFDVRGEVEGGRLEGALDAAGQTTPFAFPVGEFPLLADGLGLAAANMPLLRPGQTAYLDVFDPITFSTSKAKLTCTGIETLTIGEETLRTHRIEMIAGPLNTTVWITSDEEIVRVETPFGFQLRKISPEEALPGPPRHEKEGDPPLDSADTSPPSTPEAAGE